MENKFAQLIACIFAGFTATAACAGDAANGKDYTNFGNDLRIPIFPKDGVLKVYRNKTDKLPAYISKDAAAIDLLDTDWKSCLYPKNGDTWVRCSVSTTTGWVHRADFLAGGEYQPVLDWPIRYWLNIASSGVGGEESYMIRRAAKKSPYLVSPPEYDTIFFKVAFDHEGYATSLKTGKRTGDRVFLVGNAVYLAPAVAQERDRATWIFLNYFNPKLQAMCPAENPDSCYSAANLAANWPGIRALNTEPSAQYAYNEERQRNEKKAWFGAQEVAFARQTNAIIPFMFSVPEDVHMEIDQSNLTDAQRRKNHATAFCIMDCVQKSAVKK